MRTATLVQSRSKSEQKKTLEMIKSIPTAITGQLKFPQIKQQTETIVYKVASIGDLVSGTNIGAILPVKIVMHLDKPSEVPMGCLIVDSKSTFAVASFYGTNKTLTEKLRTGDLCYIKNPQLVFTSIEFRGRLCSY